MYSWNVLIFARTVITVGTLLFGSFAAQAQSYTWENYNVITFGDFSTASFVEGRTLVGGNLYGANSPSFATNMPSGTSATDRTLVVGGFISGGNPMNLDKGSLYLGGSTNGRIINYNGGQGAGKVTESIDLAALKQSFISESANFKAMATDSTVIVPTNGQPGPVVFNANPGSDGVAVFSISADAIFGNDKAQSYDLNPNGASSVVINVSGSSINWIQNAGNMVNNLIKDEWEAKIVWNFYEATTLNFGSHNFHGAILAPKAAMSTSARFDGTVIVDSLSTTADIHLPTSGSATSYAGFRLQAVPEPGSPLLVMVAGVILLVRRRSQLRR
ncbi:MAG TPA: choice-of-anchor A family protein [Verrucomicrobium sp.]|nr:choice-of-anchor A family protein [Verrucomicrobium sp.]